MSEHGISAKTRQALEIVKAAGLIRPREFAEKMWPDSEGWQRMAKCGPSGVTQGGGMPQAAGGYLGKLRARGLLRWVSEPRLSGLRDRGYRLADGGYKALRDA